ncbi:hypothetical protein FC24_GL001165 [Loigolactobacillus rennini DSM 20253]|uniref:Uncharacterized protein n=1 Tax=Loigolactobacillus rennini DSM 20253 TaxID=1423796 RepID=A0A0R2DDF2_9LACO|nr:hypothetical protein FC24_GL001165 [Loigolactobacillus rennini DSM 20253]
MAGIMMIILAVFIFFQSAVAGMGNALANNNESGGSAGVIAAIGYLIAGIVYIVVHKSNKLSGDIVNLIILLLVWLMGISGAGSYGDLTVWAWLAFIIGVGFFVWHYLINRKNKKN